MDVPATLTCPKCGAEMRSYERNGVLVDQCTGCGGLFLDRGGDDDRGREEHRPKKSRKRSFLENLFEGD